MGLRFELASMVALNMGFLVFAFTPGSITCRTNLGWFDLILVIFFGYLKAIQGLGF
jgi:hypothetical protein